MSDDVYAIRTTYQDVAELGQGYLERADGERILLPLPIEIDPGEGVRFIVYLTDGTPAFAGAGRAAQVSDQGTEVDSDARFETLIDALVFDERSRPVYDYIVAVRQMAYADLGAAAEAEAEVGEEAVMESDEPSGFTQAATRMHARAIDVDAQDVSVEADVGAPDQDEPDDRDAYSDVTPHSNAPAAFAQTHREARRDSADDFGAGIHGESPADSELGAEVPTSITPAPLPTGILRRPGIAAQWAIAAPRRPAPAQGSGLFLYPPGTLPAPDKPPRPQL